MYTQYLTDLTNNYLNRKYLISLSLDKNKKNAIIEATSWYYADAPIKFRCFLIQNDIHDAPVCPNCGKMSSYNKATGDKFIKFCSDSCSKEYGRLNDDIKSKLESRDWLYNKRVIDKMSYGAIGDLLGISVIPVKKYCKIHDIPEFKLNESEYSVNLKLADKDFLYNEHVIEHKKLQYIADEIGSSKATVSIWMAKHEIPTNNINSYQRTFKKSSLEEEDVVDYIKSLGVNVRTGDRKILNGLELDIVCDDNKVAFEYNGIHYHKFNPKYDDFSKRKDKDYHVHKTDEVEKYGYQLIHIYSDDWLLNKEVTKSVISAKLGKFNRTIYARKCSIREITKHEKSTFLNQTHLQGNDKSTYAYGLYFEDECVSVMTFCKSRYNKNFDWELSRFSVSKFTNVPGGFSKLLMHFRRQHAGSIVSYADRSISTGNVYIKNGFELLKVNRPNYHYIAPNSIKRLHRAAFMKNRIAPNDPRSEWEILQELGYSKIYNSGTKTFVLSSIK